MMVEVLRQVMIDSGNVEMSLAKRVGRTRGGTVRERIPQQGCVSGGADGDG
jgi:hypothetical protein